jgi:2-keto-3-deoxy-L-rhamnonate aldolase RhmA
MQTPELMPIEPQETFLPPQLIAIAHDMGFTFIAVGSDGGLVVAGMKNNMDALRDYKS